MSDNDAAIERKDCYVGRRDFAGVADRAQSSKVTLRRIIKSASRAVFASARVRFRFEGEIHYRGKDIYAKSIDPVAVRRTIGMVFQKPNPFAMTMYRNVAYGLKLNGYKGNRDKTAFLYVDTGAGEQTGYLVEYGDTREIFENPKQKPTQEYIQGDFS